MQYHEKSLNKHKIPIFCLVPCTQNSTSNMNMRPKVKFFSTRSTGLYM